MRAGLEIEMIKLVMSHAIGVFATTLSFLFSTLGWEPSLGGFPALSAFPGQFLLKDIVCLGASVWSLGESLRAVEV
jgi:uncharacterized membrane protein YkgB